MKRYWVFVATVLILVGMVAWLALSTPHTLVPDRGWGDWLVSADPWSVSDVMIVGLWLVGISALAGVWIYAWGAEWLDLRHERRRQR